MLISQKDLGELSSRDGAPRRVIVIAAPPTPNGDLHVGHLSGPYLAADIHTRYLRLRGMEVHSFCGTDDNQSDVLTKAEQMGMSPQDTAELGAGEIAATLSAARIEFDHFIRPVASPDYAPLAQKLFRRLYERGELVARDAPAPYCEGCDRYLYEGYIAGRCPHCGSRSTGSFCEDCGFPNDSIDLLDAVCTRCGAPPAVRSLTRLHFPLSRHVNALWEHWQRVEMSPNLRSFCERVVEAGLPDIGATHVSRWGIPVPISGFDQQVILTWCEEAARYLSYAQALGEDWEHVWKSAEVTAVQCFGFDNSFYYAVFLTAVLHAFDREIRLPSALLMNEFCLLEGAKFSTSRRHAIWGRDLLSVVPADLLRFYLAAIHPEVERMSFRLTEFADAVDGKLLGEWQPWLTDTAARMRQEFGGRAPAIGAWTQQHRTFAILLKALTAEAAQAYETRTFSPRRAVRILGDLVREARHFAKSEESWRRVSARSRERQTAAALELLAVKQLAILSAPILPDFAQRLWYELGYDGPPSEHRWETQPSWVPNGQVLRGMGTSPYFTSVREALQRKWPSLRVERSLA